MSVRSRRRAGKEISPSFRVKLSIREAAKCQSWATALEAYQEARAQGIPLGADSYDVLLFLCSGGETWDAALQAGMRARSGSGTGDGAALHSAPPSGPDAAAPAAAQPPLDAQRQLGMGRRLFEEMKEVDKIARPSEMWCVVWGGGERCVCPWVSPHRRRMARTRTGNAPP